MSPVGKRPVPAVEPRAAATTLVLRDGSAGIELLMLKRSMAASFMPGSYVFPGGAVDAEDGSAAALARCDEPAAALQQRIGSVTGVGALAAAFAVAALRECFEECGLWLGAAEPPPPAARASLRGGASFAAAAADAGLALCTRALLPYDRWVTPVGLPKRFDTLFLVARAPDGQVPEVDAGEATTLEWVQPQSALDAAKRGDLPLEFATRCLLRSLAPFAARPVQALLDHAAQLARIPPVHPRLTISADGSISGVLLPGQPGYDTALG